MAETAKRYNSILNIIEDRLLPDDAAKKARGEVFTPLNLVREMLFGLRKSALEKLKGALPNIKSKEYNKLIWGIDEEGNFTENDEKDRIGGIPLEVWRDPQTKWLDPASGIGNFPVVVFYMLDYQLGKHAFGKDAEKFKGDKNIADRRRHILRNMLFMIELNKGNVNTAIKIFEKIVPGVKANICCANTLEITEDNLKTEFKTDKFHVIMGNPPYNSGGVKSSGKGEENYETIWYHFVHKSSKKFPGSLNLLNQNGYLCFIHPSSWLHINDNAKMNKVLLSYDLQFIRIFTDTQSGNIFSGGGMLRTAYYILKKNTPGDNIIVLDTDNVIEDLSRDKIDKDEFTIYSNNNSILNKVYNKFAPIGEIKDDEGLPYLKTSGKIKGQVATGEYRNIVSHTKDGVEVCKSSIEFPNWKRNKIILKGARNLFHFDDYDKSPDSGKYGIYGNMGFYIYDSFENLEKFSNFFDTNLAKIIMNSTKEDQSFIEPKYIPDIRKYEGIINDKELSEKLGIDFNHVKSFKFIPNNQNVYKETKGCSPKGRKTLVVNSKNGNSIPPRNVTRKSCLPPKEIHPKTGKCVEACKAPKARNLLTGRCVNPPRATGKKGKAAAKPRRVTRKIRRT